MILIVGGAGQPLSGRAEALASPDTIMVDALHLLLRGELAAGRDPRRLVSQIPPDSIVTCAEIGCGVVPLDRFERVWREEVGRACCLLAERAERVERMVCGLPIIIKGEAI